MAFVNESGAPSGVDWFTIISDQARQWVDAFRTPAPVIVTPTQPWQVDSPRTVGTLDQSTLTLIVVGVVLIMVLNR